MPGAHVARSPSFGHVRHFDSFYDGHRCAARNGSRFIDYQPDGAVWPRGLNAIEGDGPPQRGRLEWGMKS